MIKKFNALLKDLSVLCENTPLLPKESARFGNPAFKTWYTGAIEVSIVFCGSGSDCLERERVLQDYVDW
jgi:hypothetical protein